MFVNYPSMFLNKAVRQSSDLLFIAASFWFEESPCAVRTNTAGLGRLCTLFVLSTMLVFEHMHAVLSSTIVLSVCRHRSDKKRVFDPIFETALGSSQRRTMGECLQTDWKALLLPL